MSTVEKIKNLNSIEWPENWNKNGIFSIGGETIEKAVKFIETLISLGCIPPDIVSATSDREILLEWENMSIYIYEDSIRVEVY